MFSLLNHRRHPWSEFGADFSDFNRLLSQAFSGIGEAEVETIAVNVYSGEDAAQVVASVPGWQAEWFDLSVEGNRLSLTGEAPSDDENKPSLKRFQRTVKLPFRVDPDQILASYKSGLLTIDLLKNEQDRARKIEIKA